MIELLAFVGVYVLGVISGVALALGIANWLVGDRY